MRANFAPFGTVAFYGPKELRPVIDRIFDRFPEARNFNPCECGVTLAIIPRTSVQPDIHFPVEDDAIRDEVARLITTYRLPHSNYPGGVLIMSERA